MKVWLVVTVFVFGFLVNQASASFSACYLTDVQCLAPDFLPGYSPTTSGM